MTSNGMKNYNPKKIELKWQKKWEEDKIYKTSDDPTLPKQYILDMFPYPSGEGLHVGHPRGYIATDIYSRMKRMQGFNVLHPMGWDAFGLPAENFAIANKIHPREAVDKNITMFKKQLSIMGMDYDWSREINTTDPAFYKWTQWIFLQMYKKGLAYESYEPINWCSNCQTGLANEDVETDGTCERCGTVVEKKPIRQWVLKITDYADRLLADLDKLPKWPDGVKDAQRNWIGRRQGAEIEFKLTSGGQPIEYTIKVFTTRADTLFGVTFLVLAPEHELSQFVLPYQREVEKYIEDTQKKFELERVTKNKERTGVELKGLMAVNPVNGKEIPIWIADYVLPHYGTGAVMAVPRHNKNDYEFAKEKNQKMIWVITDAEFSDTTNSIPNECYEGTEGFLINSDEFNSFSLDKAREKITKKYGKITTSYRIKDWVFSRQRYWGEPIPIIHCDKCSVVPVPESDLPVLLPEVKNYEPTGTGESPLANIIDWVNVPCPTCGGKAKRETNTMPQWAGSSWYYLAYIMRGISNLEFSISKYKDVLKHWMPVDVYVGGDHATRHLIYARFWHKFLFDIGVVSSEEPFPRLEFLGFILAEDGRKMSKRWKNIINPDDMVDRFGADSFRLYEMFIGPFEYTAPWNTNGLVGTTRFLEKVWKVASRINTEENSHELVTNNSLEILLHKTIKKVSEDIESFKFNTAISTMMIYVNEIESTFTKGSDVTKDDFKKFLQLLAPFAPHICEELRFLLGEKKSIHLSSWPKWDESKIKDDKIKIILQVNGKMRGNMNVSANATEDDIKEQAMQNEIVMKWVLGKEPQKVIYVKNRLVNIVVG